MRLRIHRGANEIGGNCMEIESRGHSILLDLGLPLTADAVDPSLLPDIPGLTDGSNPHLLGGRPAGARRLQQFVNWMVW
jgi:ribonuclease J